MLESLIAAGLTPREAEVLRFVALGRSNQHIAAELGISDRTVGKHLEHGFRKLGVGDRSSAAARAWALAGVHVRSDAQGTQPVGQGLAVARHGSSRQSA